MQSVIDAYFGPAGAQQIVGSDILDEVNRDGDLEEGITYTNIVTRSDAVVVPPESCFLAPDKVKDGTVRNIYVQDFDRRAVVLHHDLPVDKRVRVIARTILRQIGPMWDHIKTDPKRLRVRQRQGQLGCATRSSRGYLHGLARR